MPRIPVDNNIDLCPGVTTPWPASTSILRSAARRSGAPGEAWSSWIYSRQEVDISTAGQDKHFQTIQEWLLSVYLPRAGDVRPRGARDGADCVRVRGARGGRGGAVSPGLRGAALPGVEDGGGARPGHLPARLAPRHPGADTIRQDTQIRYNIISFPGYLAEILSSKVLMF